MLQLYKNIRERRKALGMSQEELARRAGYSGKSMIARIERGDVDLPQSKILAIAAALYISPSDLMGWDEPATQVFTVAAGRPKYNGDYSTETTSIIHLEPNEYVAIVHGDSMSPTLEDGDLVVIRAQSVVEYNGDIALVKINGNESTIKRVEKTSEYLKVYGDNPHVFPPRFFTPREVAELPITIEGKVIRLVRDL
ncbi:MAG: helix-turn-helix domain-containing protein [Mogibacterium sp.]|nr:helix-turn-helix domain-containing protein [Mogibacterium sp.]